MTDLPSIIAAYIVVLGGIVGYAWYVARRVDTARRIAAALERQREAAEPGAPKPTSLDLGPPEDAR